MIGGTALPMQRLLCQRCHAYIGHAEQAATARVQIRCGNCGLHNDVRAALARVSR